MMFSYVLIDVYLEKQFLLSYVSMSRAEEIVLFLFCVQGLKWYAKRLRVDEDGDVADEFLDEVLPKTPNGTENQRKLPRFEVKYSARPAKVKSQMLSLDGKIQQCVEHHGRLQWV